MAGIAVLHFFRRFPCHCRMLHVCQFDGRGHPGTPSRRRRESGVVCALFSDVAISD